MSGSNCFYAQSSLYAASKPALIASSATELRTTWSLGNAKIIEPKSLDATNAL